MEEAGLLQSKELYQYLLKTSVYPTEQEFVKELREATAKHPEACMGTGPDAGQLMTLLLKLINAKKTIEIGVFTGYSLLLTALSLPKDGKITAIDINGEAYETVGAPIVRKAGVEHKIDFIVSPAHPVLDKLLENTENEGSFDFAYVDADKDNYINYHEKLLKLVRVGGVILYDNTLCGGTVAIEDKSTITEPYYIYNTPFAIELNKFLATDTRIQIAHIPVSDGSTICIRLH